MLPYQNRRRVFFRLDEDLELDFPNTFRFEVILDPPTPFGGAVGRGRTATQGAQVSSSWDMNTGRTWSESDVAFDPVDLAGELFDLSVTIKGHVFVVEGSADDHHALANSLDSFLYLLPVLLNLEFSDTPIITKIVGWVGEAPFVWALPSSAYAVEVTNTERQQDKIMRSLARLPPLFPIENRRLAAALHYYFVACRLERVGNSPWEFLSEILLNLAKVLETLFPPSGDEGTMDSARAGLSQLGFESEEIERDFVSVIALRNYLDVGHPSLALFEEGQLAVVHDFCEGVEQPFRDMLARLIDQISEGALEIAPYEATAPRSEVMAIIDRIAARAGQEHPPPEPAS